MNMERPSKEKRQQELAAEVYKNFFKYNILYPQMSLGISASLVHLFLRKHAGINEIKELQLSEKQYDHLLKKAKIVHNKFGIPEKGLSFSRMRTLWLTFKGVVLEHFRLFSKHYCPLSHERESNWERIMEEMAKYYSILQQILDSKEFIEKSKLRNQQISQKLRSVDTRALPREIVELWEERCKQELTEFPNRDHWFEAVKLMLY